MVLLIPIFVLSVYLALQGQNGGTISLNTPKKNLDTFARHQLAFALPPEIVLRTFGDAPSAE